MLSSRGVEPNKSGLLGQSIAIGGNFANKNVCCKPCFIGTALLSGPLVYLGLVTSPDCRQFTASSYTSDEGEI